MAESTPPMYPMPSTVYGPVNSWRYGRSLGIDLIVRSSICSFNCVYCQLGNIQEVTAKQEVFVPTERVAADLAAVDWSEVDIATLSGSGEPTLALNIGEVIDIVKDRHHGRVLVLTNATMLDDEATRARLMRADVLACKIDAASDAMLQRVNRPAAGVTLRRIVEGIRGLRDDGYTGTLALQCMFMPMNKGEAEALAKIISAIQPDEVQLNTPKRPHPQAWYLEARGNHGGTAPVPESTLRTVSLEEAQEVERIIRDANPDVTILSVYRHAPGA